MIDSRQALINALTAYTTTYKEEQLFCTSFLTLLQHPPCYHRDHLPGHITGSAWIIDKTNTFTLLTHHAKLNKWLQPGGHADGDENIVRVALREATEETGLKNVHLVTPEIFDIDIHTIPERNGFPEHLHFDIRFLLMAAKDMPLIITKESKDLQWVNLNELEKFTTNNSVLRMKQKTILK